MSKTTIEDLVYKISADMTDFKKSMNDIATSTAKAQQEGSGAFSKLGGSIDDFKKIAGTLGIAFGISELVSFTKASVSFANQIGETAEKVGITTKSLQELRFAASQNGSSVEEMDAALIKFNSVIGDAASGNKAAELSFNTLGVNIRNANGEIKSADQLMRETSDKISTLSSSSEKASIMMDLFGRSGGKLVPVLGEGSRALDEMAISAQNAGAIMSDDTVKAAKQLNDQLDKISTSAKVLMAEALGTVSKAVGKAVDWVGDAIIGMMDKTQGFTVIEAAAVKSNDAINKLEEDRVKKNKKNLADMAEAARQRQEVEADIQEIMKRGIASESDAKSKAIEKELEILYQNKDKKLAMDQEFRDAISEREILLAETKSEEAAKEVERMVAQQEMLNQIDANRNATQVASLQAAIEAKTELVKVGSDARLKIEVARRKKEKELLNSQLNDTEEAANTIMSLTKKSNQSQFEAAKTASQAMAVIKGILAVQQAWASAPFPANIPAVVKTTAATIANVSKIKSVAFGAEKGVDMLPGTGIKDSIPSMLAPGERVVPRDTNKMLEKFLRGMEGGSGSGGKVIIEFKGNLDTLTDLFQAKLEERGVLQLSSQSA